KRGLSVVLEVPPGALVDSGGNPVSGQGKAYVWGYPPGTSIPGDMSATFGGRPARMQTFGAVDITLTDAGGQPLQVRSGASIGLNMQPASANPPATVPFFMFDDVSGLWQQRGTLTLVAGRYKGTINHLSTFNADLAFGTT